jgi:hypothetical protein
VDSEWPGSPGRVKQASLGCGRRAVPWPVSYAGSAEVGLLGPVTKRRLSEELMQNLTKVEIEELKESLLHVPKTKRGPAWLKTIQFVDDLLNSGNNLAIRTFADELHYSVRCSLCKYLIKIGDEFVSRVGDYQHLDCWKINPEVVE